MSVSARLFTAGGFLSFFIFGFIDNMKGPLLPHLLRAGDFTYGQGANILLAGYIGFIVGTLSTGVLADLLSSRAVLLFSAACLTVGTAGFATANSFATWMASMGAVGLGLGAIELGGNALIGELHPGKRGRYLNLLGMFHGLGSLLVPLYAAWLLTWKVHWQVIYGSSILLVLPLAIIFLPPLRRRQRAVLLSQSALEASPGGGESTWNGRAVLQSAFSRRMGAYYLLLGAYVASELGIATWMVEFLQQERGMTIAASSLFLSSFFILLTAGRLLGAWVVEPIGYFQSIAVALIGSAVCLAIGIYGAGNLVYALPLSGLFMSIVFPTVAAATSDASRANTGSMLGILFAFAGVGGAVGPWTVGYVGDLAGLEAGLASCIAFTLVAMIALGMLRKWST